MSGILLPGQEKQPKPEGGIELPKGYSRRQEKSQENPQEKPAEAAAPPASPPSERPARRSADARRQGQPAVDFLFPPRGVQVRCPSCGTNYAAPIFTIIDLGANSELRGAILGGQVNVAVCPNCGVGGALGAPLMVHDPAHQFLGVYMPVGSSADEAQRQKVIGDLAQTLMRKLPTEARKGYMLQPRQYGDWQRFLEKLWEFEGVTPEMLRRQREQTALLQRLVSLAGDDKALDIALERSLHLVDRDFFAMLDQVILVARAQGQSQEAEPVLRLRQKLLDSTEAGRTLKQQEEKIRGFLARIKPSTTRQELLSVVLDAWKEEDGVQMVTTLALAVAPLLDYQFLMLLSQRLEETINSEERKRLEELRNLLVEMQSRLADQQRQNQEAMVQHVQMVLQEVLQAGDMAAALRQHAEDIDEAFLALLAANIEQAERNKATAAARRLRQIYQQALNIFQENLPPEIQLLNRLLDAPDEAAARQLLKENRSLLTKEFLDALKPLENEMRNNGRSEIADRLKSLRGQAALMV